MNIINYSKIKKVEAELTSHKEDYTTQRQQDQLKVALVEKELNDYKSTMANVNVNQEAKQSVSGYGIISLPKNAANGQVSVSVKGNIWTNLLGIANVPSTINSLGVGSRITIDTNGQINRNSTGMKTYNFVQGNKYYVRFKLKPSSTGGMQNHIRVQVSTSIVIKSDKTKVLEVSTIWTATENNIGYFYSVESIETGSLDLDYATVYNLTEIFGAGKEPTEEWCNANLYYISNTKSTVSASRLRSQSRNLSVINDWEQGTLTSAGADYVDNNGIRTKFRKIKSGDYVFKIHNPLQDYLTTQIHWYDASKTFIGRNSSTATTKNFTIPENAVYYRIYYKNNSTNITPDKVKELQIQVEKGTIATPYEPYTESTQYLPNVGELRSVSSAKDEIRVIQNKAEHIQRVGVKTNVASGTVINYADMATGGQFVARASDGTTQTGVKGDTLTITAVTLTYQLANPIVTPVEVSGTLLSYPSGAVYVEPVVADAGVYSDKMTILHSDLPIDYIEKLSKVNYITGLETDLDVSIAIIAEDKLSFTHPDLIDGDIVFFTYFHNIEGTQGELSLDFYDSRYVLKDSVTGKFYKVVQTVADGVLTNTLVEV